MIVPNMGFKSRSRNRNQPRGPSDHVEELLGKSVETLDHCESGVLLLNWGWTPLDVTFGRNPFLI